MVDAELMESQEIEVVRTQALTWPEKVRSLTIKDAESLGEANALTKAIQLLRKQIGAVFDPIIEKAKEAKRAAEAARKEAEDQKIKVEAPLVQAENILYPKIDAYLQEERRKAAEEEARIREAARKTEEEARLAAAVEAEKNGDMEVAEQILETPAAIPRPHIPVPKVENLTFRENWSAEVFSLTAFARGIAEGTIPIPIADLNGKYHGAWMPNLPYLNKEAEHNHNEMRIPGVRAVMKRTPVRG